jgi:hypothetical protein
MFTHGGEVGGLTTSLGTLEARLPDQVIRQLFAGKLARYNAPHGLCMMIQSRDEDRRRGEEE